MKSLRVEFVSIVLSMVTSEPGAFRLRRVFVIVKFVALIKEKENSYGVDEATVIEITSVLTKQN